MAEQDDSAATLTPSSAPGDSSAAARNEECEAQIMKTNSILVLLSQPDEEAEAEDLAKDFCGTLLSDTEFHRHPTNFTNKTVYLCGDIAKAGQLDLTKAERVFVIGNLSHGLQDENHIAGLDVVDSGRVPLLLHGVGVLYKRFFDSQTNYFDRILSEHAFQTLTESTKPGRAHRTGAYLTPVMRDAQTADLHFRLLRCSSNFSGPSLNFRANDRHIVDALNREAACIFQNPASLNHVLAQIYHNEPATGFQKQTKAKIKAHADKTKDMPTNGIMAFCTFYDQLQGLRPMSTDRFDYGYSGKGTSGLTRLHFRLKPTAADRTGCNLPSQFSVTLYPNSVFLMPLSTNRLYTHEIRPSALDTKLLPTRLGYVVRCSATDAVHMGGCTHIETRDGSLVKLESPTPEGMDELRKLYAKENATDAIVDYGGKFLFSMNEGDYMTPEYNPADEFRQYSLPITDADHFRELLESVQFEDVVKGRRGTVIVKPDKKRGTPIVRTTSKYSAPAQCFNSVHVELARQIEHSASLPVRFNNALIEHYTNAYTTMGLHVDQALDLEDESFIVVFSCYKHPERAKPPPRKLVIEPKGKDIDAFEIPLIHNSVVVFSLDTNTRFRHKIVLDRAANPGENQWLGVTFRTSKTFVQFDSDHCACFKMEHPLRWQMIHRAANFTSCAAERTGKLVSRTHG